MGKKISDGNYGSVDYHFSYSSDVGYLETLDEATERVVTFVEEVLSRKINNKPLKSGRNEDL